MRIRIALTATALAASAVMGTAGAAAANDPPPVSQTTGDSPGILSGDNILVPIHIPVNVCGNSVNVIGLLNPASGNTCTNN
ncbi:hypothetical protein GCM10010289_05620 [Streptomyces violascens]|uniref:Chaplin domain-containing protein n=2 Tax=Streptomyces violascens TaxID=67381 RepID=A0ABQ3QG30_9ACTN|nr:hypothetical protein GCM10010289_05620 [Streptomyces violascens]GHI36228.1 hypothetical protein Sviol_06360 [Streptomyces violascens]